MAVQTNTGPVTSVDVAPKKPRVPSADVGQKNPRVPPADVGRNEPRVPPTDVPPKNPRVPPTDVPPKNPRVPPTDVPPENPRVPPTDVPPKKPRVSPTEMLTELRKAHPDAHCELDHASPFQLLVATVLSAQTTDVAVNKATPALFAAYPDAKSLAAAPPEDVEAKLSTIGMFRQKTRNVTKLAKLVCERHDGEVPRTMEALVALPGVGRKTANVVLGVAFGTPEGVVVDTHVQRLSQRLGFTKETEPEKIEKALCAKLPRDVWDITSHTLIFHGRRVCFAKKPACGMCTLSAMCPSAFVAEEIGRKPKRVRLPVAPESDVRVDRRGRTPTRRDPRAGAKSGTARPKTSPGRASKTSSVASPKTAVLSGSASSTPTKKQR